MAESRLCVIGLGYMGLPTALLFAKAGVSVIGYDIDESKISQLQKGVLPFEEKGLPTLFNAAKANFSAVSGLSEEILSDINVFIICVPTPFRPDRSCDLGYVEKAIESIMPYVAKDALVILEATVTPGTTVNYVAPLFSKKGKQPSKDFQLAYVSEKAIPGNTIYEMVENDRIVGGLDLASGKVAAEFYKKIVNGKILETDATTAEAVKVVENAFRDLNIAYANELVKICDVLRINVWEVIALANRHPRVNILAPGPGVGGHCIAIDPWFLFEIYPSKLIENARMTNDSMPLYVLASLQRIIALEGIEKPIVGLLGTAYKKNVDDHRDSPTHEIYRLCLEAGFNTFAHDPFVQDNPYTLVKSIDLLLKDSNILILCTDHDDYLNIDFGDLPVLNTRNQNLRGNKIHVMGHRPNA